MTKNIVCSDSTSKHTSGTSSSNKISYFYFNENSSFFQTVLGGTVLLAFIVIWISSLASPFLLYTSIHYQHFSIAYGIVFLTLCAYLPWKKGFISKISTAWVRNYHNKYYKKCTILFKGSSLPNGTKHADVNDKNVNKKPLFYAIHPHGTFCLGWSLLFAHSKMTTVRFCFSPALYASPFFKLWSRLIGNPGRADKPSMISYMKKRENLALPPGGFEEATLTSPNHDRVYIKKRIGFIKLALQYGYDVVPVYCFGENKTYNNMQGGWKARLKINSFGIPAIAVYGMPLLPMLPKRHKCGLYVAVGEPLELPRIESPSREEVKMWHNRYIAALVKVFEDHKCDAYGNEEGKVQKMDLW